jgi:hypothetical protein
VAAVAGNRPTLLISRAVARIEYLRHACRIARLPQVLTGRVDQSRIRTVSIAEHAKQGHSPLAPPNRDAELTHSALQGSARSDRP